MSSKPLELTATPVAAATPSPMTSTMVMGPAANAAPDSAAPTGDEKTTETAAPARKRGSLAKKVALFILFSIVALLAWYVASDRMAPYSAVGAVNAAITQVAPRVAGSVVEVAAADNQYVEKGDVLFRLDPRPFDIAVRQAEANYAQAVQTVGAANLSLSAVQARLEQAQSALEYARGVTDRNRQLLEKGLLTQVQADKSETDLLAAQTVLQAATSDYDSAALKAGGDEISNPQLAGAAATLEQARLNQEFADITAPASGVITNLRLAAGQYISAGTPALTFIGSANMMLAIGATFVLMFPTSETLQAEAWERSFSTLLGGGVGIVIILIVNVVAHPLIFLLLVALGALYFSQRIIDGRHPAMVYQFGASAMISVATAAVGGQEPTYALLTRVVLTFGGAVAAAYLTILLEAVFIGKKTVDTTT